MNTIELIRSVTREQHQQLDGFLSPYFMQANNPQAYGRILQGFAAFFDPMMAEIDQYITPQILPDKQLRRTTQPLHQDLKALSMNNYEPTVQPILPTIDSLPKALGAYYVLEGSTLGGVYLASILSKNGIPQEALNFFTGYGPSSKSMWNNFIEMLNSYTRPEDQQAIADAAKETFKSFSMFLHQFL